MYRIFRIISCVLAAAGAAATVFVFIYCDWWGFLALGLTLAFAGLMLLFKNLQEREELKKNPPPPVGDFITGKVRDEDTAERQTKE